MNNLKSSFLLCLALVIALPASSRAGDKKKSTVEKHEMLIASVSANAITVTEDNATKTLPITPQTEIDLKGQRATIADLKPGMMLTVTHGVDGASVTRVNAEDAPVPRREEKKKVKVPRGFMR